MAIDNAKSYRIRNSAGREVEVNGDVLRLRALNNEDDVLISEGDEISVAEFIVQGGDVSDAAAKRSMRAAQERLREQRVAAQELSEVNRRRVLKARAKEEELAATAQLLRATNNQPGAAERAENFLNTVDDYNRNRAAGVLVPAESEDAVETPEVSLGQTNAESARQTNRQLEEARTRRTRQESQNDESASDGGPVAE